MSKRGGLGNLLFVAGYDLSGDTGSIQRIGGGPAFLEAPGINSSAMERIPALKSGEISFQSFFNDAALQEHAALSGLPATDIHFMFLIGSTLGDPGAGLVAKQIDYPWGRGQDGSMLANIQGQSNGTTVALEWGRSLTAGKRTDTAATNGTAIDDGASQGAAAVNIVSSSIANPTQVTATTHGLITGDSVVIAGHTSTPDINGNWEVTRISDDIFTIPIEVTGGGGANGTVTKTSTSFGLSAYLQIFSFTGTSVTATVEHSPDNVTFAAVTGGAFAAATALGTQRIATTSTRTIQRYLRLATSGTFNPSTFACVVARHKVATL